MVGASGGQHPQRAHSRRPGLHFLLHRGNARRRHRRSDIAGRGRVLRYVAGSVGRLQRQLGSVSVRAIGQRLLERHLDRPLCRALRTDAWQRQRHRARGWWRSGAGRGHGRHRRRRRDREPGRRAFPAVRCAGNADARDLVLRFL